MSPGFNPMRWDCRTKGCFNKKRRPKIEVFHDLFPRRISFGDVDGIVEINGYALVLEWKGHSVPIPVGQRIMWERLTESGMIVVLVVEGDAESMVVSGIAHFKRGKLYDSKDANMDELRRMIKSWVDWAESNK
jgi:hypothetical protein